MKLCSAWEVFRFFARCERGATAVEYTLIASAIAVVLVAGMGQVGTGLEQAFDTIAAGFAN